MLNPVRCPVCDSTVSTNTASERTLEAVLRRIDSEAYSILQFIEECGREGQWGGETQRRYISSYNTLVILRQKMTREALGDTENLDNNGVEALSRVSVEQKPDGTPYLHFFE